MNGLSRTVGSQSRQFREAAGYGLPPAVIAGAYQTGVLGVRSLQRRGVNVRLFDCDSSMPGFKSVYGPALLCPDPDIHSEAWLHFMLDMASKCEQRPVLIASADNFVSAIAAHAKPLEAYYIFSPSVALHAQLAEKQTQYDLAQKYGMPLPRTKLVSSLDEVRAFAREATFPCIMKPTHFRKWQKFTGNHPLLGAKVSVAYDVPQLCKSYEIAAHVTPEVILQELIQGDDSCKVIYLSCYDSRGRCIGHAMLRELRCDPIGFGPASVTEPVLDPEVAEICDSFLRKIGYTGICEIEMKRDARDGRPKLIEANPRLSGSGDAAPYAGVDLCWLHYMDLIGQQPEPVVARNGDFRHIALRSDARAIPAYLHARAITWRDVWHSYRRPRAFFDLDWHDWRYSIETLYLALRALVWRLLRGSFRRRWRR